MKDFRQRAFVGLIGLVSAGLLSVGCSSSSNNHGQRRQQRLGRLAHGRQHRHGHGGSSGAQRRGHRRRRAP